MIPKIIHYCWFGGAEIPTEYKNYINDWKVFHPNWEIIQWDESNSPMDVPYLKNAHSAKEWSNMSNFIRTWALKNHGGIYLDTDMKMIKPLDECLKNECFFGYEEVDSSKKIFWINNAISGAVKEHPFIIKCYERITKDFDGREQSNLSGPRLVTALLKEIGLTEYKEEIDNIKLYPTDFFYPIHYEDMYDINNLQNYITQNTICIHMWARTWITKEQIIKDYDDKVYEYNSLKSTNDKHVEALLYYEKELQKNQQENEHLKIVVEKEQEEKNTLNLLLEQYRNLFIYSNFWEYFKYGIKTRKQLK